MVISNGVKKIFIVVAIILIGSGLYFYKTGFLINLTQTMDFQSDAEENLVKIGYFFGGRIHAIYRAYINKYFEAEGIDVELYAQYLLKDDWIKVPKSHEEMMKLTLPKEEGGAMGREFGKVTGVRIIKAMEQGLFAGGTPGESSFVDEVTNGSPIVAVAMLGHDDKQNPGKSIVVRKGLTINSPEDFKGKRFISRRAGPGDSIYLREFIESIGLDPEKDVTIMDQTPDNEQAKLLATGEADAALLHMHGVSQIEAAGIAYLYRGMDWMNPELSQALLVFRKDFIEEHPEKVKAIIRAYMKRIKYEHSLPEEEKYKPADFGIRIMHHYKGLSLPIFDWPPMVRLDLLEEVQRLLLKYKFIDKEVDLKEFINNDFVKEIYEELK